ncbi:MULTISPECIES: MlaD family protein [unclassified Mycobacterium]|uniref:MlaD family protein n=1 Tax=unclassified Mycobacterium TaxID=2642494 RepID=UPI0029C6B633|nr:MULTISPECIES: MlaD family protein [unclassified Mycobacterium]
MSSRARLAVAMLVVAVAVSSCASISVNSVPLPGNTYEGGYDITVEFANVLNLPDRAKVVMDGTTVGVVTRVSSTSSHVDVRCRIDRDVVVPANIRAILQQATVLGDIYVALERRDDGDPAAPLGPSSRIPLAQTTSPPQLEDTIASLANFIGSGSIQRLQNTLVRINAITPAPDQIRQMSSRVATDLKDLSTNIDVVDQWLTGLSDTTTVMAASTPAFKLWFSPPGLAGFKRNMIVANTFGKQLPSLGSVYNGGYWLVPLLKSIAGALGAIQQSKWAVEEEYPAWRRFITDYYMPQDKYPAINITSIIGPDGRELSGDVQQVLRMLGAVP